MIAKLDSSTPPPAPKAVQLSDYRHPPWRIRHAELSFDLGLASTEVTSRLHIEPVGHSQNEPLYLDGEGLELLSITLDGSPLPSERYQRDEASLTVNGLEGAGVLEIKVRIQPDKNTQLEGLYASRGLLITQCEAEGFRRITYFQDRPDIMPTWRIRLNGDKTEFPVLLANGNPVESGDLESGRHFATWENPHPTPAYLFAIVAGRLSSVDKEVVTGEGRKVRLAIWAAPSDIPQCDFALEALERALRWDEERFGRYYDLDVYNLVAAQDFTMGAMENKGLNVFNARYVLADSDTATDADYLAIESVIGHEYFHNWSGNRVTLREWFQLSLKEGFTVFRDQEFTSDLHSRPVKRIEDVRMLRARQFAEDAGALAHPVRPASYREINNFYTATIYEKGSEVVRMLHTLLGEVMFRRGSDRFFAEHDGKAVTVEDFLEAMSAESERGLEQFARWYAQAGTPEVKVNDFWDPESGTYELTITQRTPPTPGQPEKLPLTIPLRLCLYGKEGKPVTEPMQGDASRLETGEKVPGQYLYELTADTHRLRIEGLAERPLPAFNQGFAAPIKLHYDYTPADLGPLAQVEQDAFNRWEALQRLATGILLHRFPDEAAARKALVDAVGNLLADPQADPAFVAECLDLPGFDTLADMADIIDVDALLNDREGLLDELAQAHAALLEKRYQALAEPAAGGLSGEAMGARSLRNSCLLWLSRNDSEGTLAQRQFDAAQNMTDRLGALRCLVRYDLPGKDKALAAFRKRYDGNALVTDKWLSLVASRPAAPVVEEVRHLIASDWWLSANPNRVRAILGVFARSNPTAFHRLDGEGYRLLVEQLPNLDTINSQVAARMLGAFESWRRLAGKRHEEARAALASLQGKLVSRECTDLLDRLLADG